MIRTVLGDIEHSKIGITYAHEHLSIDLRRIRNEDDSVLKDTKIIYDELKPTKDYGLTTIVEVTNIGMGRDISQLQKISQLLGINIVSSTGYYKEEYFPKDIFNKSEDELCDIMVSEILEGIEGSHVKAGLIGEIGTSLHHITPTEEKVFRAAAKAHVKTGVCISTHCEMGTMAVNQCDILLSLGVEPDKIVIGHMDLNENLDNIKLALKMGVNIAFDTIGKNNYISETVRINNLLDLLHEGYENNILLSQDITRKSYLKKNGGIGYGYIFEVFLPNLKRNKISDNIINKMLIKNPQRIINIP